MSTYRFNSHQRFALFLAHGMKCYMCSTPLSMTSMQVDHVLPEQLLAKPAELDAVKSALGLSASFDLNSFENWLPACAVCNGKKAAHPFEPSPIVQVELQRLARKADETRRLCDQAVSSKDLSLALNAFERALESGLDFDATTQERLLELAKFASARHLVSKGEPLRLTQSFQLVTTSVEQATSWGATHWSLPPYEPGEPMMAVLFRAEHGECSVCAAKRRVYQPINQEGGGDPICDSCLSELDWMPAVALGDIPTHVRYVKHTLESEQT